MAVEFGEVSQKYFVLSCLVQIHHDLMSWEMFDRDVPLGHGHKLKKRLHIFMFQAQIRLLALEQDYTL